MRKWRLAAGTALLFWTMGIVSACSGGMEKPKMKELIAVEYDQISYHSNGLIYGKKQEEESWYLLTGDDVTKLSVPDGMTPWQREGTCIWITNSEKKKGIMDVNGQILLPCRYELIKAYLEGTILETYERTETGIQRCLWDRAGNKIYGISHQGGNDITAVSENAFLVRENFDYFLIDGQGRRILPGTYTGGYTSEGSGYVALGDMSSVGKPGYKKIYRADGTLAVEEEFEFVEFTGQADYPFLARRSETDNFYLMTEEGEPILTDYAIRTGHKEEKFYPLSKNLFYYRNGDVQNILNGEGAVLHTSSYGPDEDGLYPLGWMNLEKDGYGLLYGDSRWILIDAEGRERMKEATRKGNQVVYRGGSLLLTFDTDSIRIYRLETEECIYEGGRDEELSILSAYFALMENEGYRIFDRNGSEITAFPGTIKRVHEAGDWVLGIVEKDGKQGLYGLKQ